MLAFAPRYLAGWRQQRLPQVGEIELSKSGGGGGGTGGTEGSGSEEKGGGGGDLPRVAPLLTKLGKYRGCSKFVRVAKVELCTSLYKVL